MEVENATWMLTVSIIIFHYLAFIAEFPWFRGRFRLFYLKLSTATNTSETVWKNL
jgi:hypothetical protein